MIENSRTTPVKINEIIIAFTVFLIIFFFLTNESIFSPFSFEEEPKFQQITNTELGYFNTYEARNTYSNFLNYLNMYHNMGRLRPISRFIPWILAKVTNAHPLAMRLYVYLFAVLGVTFFFIYLRLLKVPFILAIFSAGIFATGRYDEIWWRIGLGETLGLVFVIMSLSFFTISINNRNYIWKVLAFISLILSALSKESFLILLPVISLVYIVTYSWNHKISYTIALKNTKQINFLIIIIFLLICIDIFSILLYGHTYRSDTLYDNRLYLIYNNLKSIFLPMVPLMIPVAILLIIYLIKRTFKSQGKYILGLTIIILLWIVSQLIIYKDFRIIGSVRYLMPAQLSLIIISALCIKHFKELKLNKLYYLFLIFFFMFFLVSAKNVYINSSFFGKRAIIYNRMIDKVSKLKPHNIAIIMEPGKNYEFLYATAFYLSNKRINVPIYYINYEGTSNIRALIRENNNPKEGFNRIDMDELIKNKAIDIVIIGSTIEYSVVDIKKLLTNLSAETYTFNEFFFNISIKDLLFRKWKETSPLNNSINYIVMKRKYYPELLNK